MSGVSISVWALEGPQGPSAAQVYPTEAKLLAPDNPGCRCCASRVRAGCHARRETMLRCRARNNVRCPWLGLHPGAWDLVRRGLFELLAILLKARTNTHCDFGDVLANRIWAVRPGHKYPGEGGRLVSLTPARSVTLATIEGQSRHGSGTAPGPGLRSNVSRSILACFPERGPTSSRRPWPRSQISETGHAAKPPRPCGRSVSASPGARNFFPKAPSSRGIAPADHALAE